MSLFMRSYLPILVALAATPAAAADLIVSKFEDSNDGVCDADCSLREAVQLANMQHGEDRVLLQAGTYTLSLAPQRQDNRPLEEDANQNGDIDVMYDDVIVRGAGQGRTIIDGGGLDRLFDVEEASSLRLERLSLHNGFTATFGGALRNRGTLELWQVTLARNEVEAEIGAGGAIANYGTLNVAASWFDDNRTLADPGSGEGGAIYNSSRGQLFVRDSTFTDNNSYDYADTGRGGAIYNAGLATVTRSAFIDNKGGEYGNGAAILNAEGGQFRLAHSTLSGNHGYYGAGVFANGQYGSRNNPTTVAQLVNVTIAANHSLRSLFNLGRLEIRNSIVAGNFYIPDEGPVRPSNCHNGADAIMRASGLMLGLDDGGCPADLPIDDGLAFTQVLDPLSSPADAPPLHELRAGSPALDAALGACLPYDQRKLPRPRDGDGDGLAVCDLGAVERQAP